MWEKLAKGKVSAEVQRASTWKDRLHLHCEGDVSDNGLMHMCKEMRQDEGGLRWPGLVVFGLEKLAGFWWKE